MKILIIDDYGNRYFDVSTPEKLEKVALSIIQARFGRNSPFLEELTKPVEPIYKESEISLLPITFRDLAENEWEDYKAKMVLYESQLKSHEVIRQCLETKDGKLALGIMKKRRYHEGEGYEFATLEETYERR
jgi:hypothetical protein